MTEIFTFLATSAPSSGQRPMFGRSPYLVRHRGTPLPRTAWPALSLQRVFCGLTAVRGQPFRGSPGDPLSLRERVARCGRQFVEHLGGVGEQFGAVEHVGGVGQEARAPVGELDAGLGTGVE